MARTGATWVRAFIDIFEIQDAGDASIASNPDVLALHQMHDDGYKVIVSLKYAFGSPDRMTFPSDPNGQAFQDLQAFTTKVLDAVYPSTDLVVVGNEPFIEVPQGQRDSNDLVLFYRHMTDHVLGYRKTHDRDVPIYVGAFNNLHDADWRGPGAQDLLGYAKDTPGVAGVDLHLHAGSVSQIQTAIDWARSKVGNQKAFITTEFSLIQHFREQTGKAINATFAQKYGIDATWKVYQYLDYAAKNGRPRTEWVDFLEASPWFVAVQDWLADTATLLQERDFAVATYGVVQQQRSLDATTSPWMLNSLYCNRTCVPDPVTAEPQFNYRWIESFQTHQW